MTPFIDPNAPPPRGIIILDAGALMHMAVPVRENSPESGIAPESYLAVLTLLADQGYRILIPETVSIEAAGVTSGGKSIQSAFRERDSFRANHMITKQFLRSAAMGNHPNIHIITQTGPSKADAYCESVQEALNAKDGTGSVKLNKSSRANSKRVEPNALKRVLLESINKQDKADLGDQAILSLIEHLPERIDNCPTIVLTDDITFHKAIKQLAARQAPSGKPCPFTMKQLMQAIENAHLEPWMGLRQAVCANDTSHHFLLDRANANNGSYKKQVPSDNWFAEIRLSDFQQSLNQLSQTMASPPDQPTETPPVSTRRDRFAKRYGNLGPDTISPVDNSR